MSVPTRLVIGSCLFCAGLAVGSMLLAPLTAQDRSAVKPEVNPQERNLDAILYLQTAAEYHACCLQAYQVAADQLLQRLQEKKPSRPAVVLDLDETVFDNTRFQTFLYRERLPYSDAWWEIFERDHADEVSLLPGAKTFIQLCQQRQVSTVFISNRSTQYLSAAQSVFTRHGVDLIGSEWLFRAPGAGGDKSVRRQLAETRFQVLLYLGDNLRDFDEAFRVSRTDEPQLDDLTVFARVEAERRQRVEAEKNRWGRDWIIFPNPIYGEWAKLVEKRPADKLRPTAMRRSK